MEAGFTITEGKDADLRYPRAKCREPRGAVKSTCKYCRKEFISKSVRNIFCSLDCQKLYKRHFHNERRKNKYKAGKVRGLRAGIPYRYVEQVKCPRCESVYKIGTNLKPGKIMRREYCEDCRMYRDDYYDIFETTELRI